MPRLPDDESLERMAELLRRKPRTTTELADELGTTVRTVQRWLRELEGRGLDVVKRGPRDAGTYAVLPR